TSAAEQAIVERLSRERIGRVFLNGSNLGRLARAVKRTNPDVEVLTFFHNVEARFFLGAFRQQPSLRALGVMVANAVAERMAVRFSDRLIALNRRDSEGIGRLYGRGASDLLPMALTETEEHSAERSKDGDYLLFVGGGFYANRDGILWFAREVAPRLSITTCVVGRGLEALRTKIERIPNVRLIGEVDALAPWYQGARAVIAPIFDGSGMKTKVAEALMYGKRVIGTSEAFVGYEEVAAEIGWCCDDANSFIAAINALGGLEIPAFDARLRLLFEQRYSYEAARNRLAAILAR
ncbi:MAG: glycosyltransferase family 4 protein, partial [Sphingomonadales bacterium]|nr:glycosyltransferase family 4 protein [Sphingomonadales bacterium]